MNTLIKELQTIVPFTYLTYKEFEKVAKSVNIAYYRAGTQLLSSGEKSDNIFCIIKGIVDVLQENELVDIFHINDTFGAIEIIEEKIEAEFFVSEDLICYEIPKNTFIHLLNNQYFKSFFMQNLLKKSTQLQSKKDHLAMSEFMMERISLEMLHPLILVNSDTSLKDALMLQEEEGASAILVNKMSTICIVTDTNIRSNLLNENFHLQMSIDELSTYPVVTISLGDFLFNALLLMTKHNIKRLPVSDSNGKFIGILEQIDLLSFFSNQSYLITAQIERAKNIDELIFASSHIKSLIDTLHIKGVKARYIAKLVNEINQKIYQKVFMIIVPLSWHKHCVLVVLGSQGRGEQILKTDQDNAFIFDDDFGIPSDLNVISNNFIDALESLGFPRCEGKVMVNNPIWSQNISRFKKQIDRWIDTPTNEDYIHTAIFFDSLPFAGEYNLHAEVRNYLLNRAKGHSEFLLHFAKSIENFPSALGMFSQFIKTKDKYHKNEIDIKKGALFALIHGVRTLSFEYNIESTNTFERIKSLNNLGFLSRDDSENLIESLDILLSLSLHSSYTDNYINPDKICKIERDLLKESLKIVESFKKTIIYHYRLSQL